jgi:23S rRNA (guanosine2251-2'-O)-methyltransferase
MSGNQGDAGATFVFFQCEAGGCGLRFPATADAGIAVCPRCGGPVTVAALAHTRPTERPLGAEVPLPQRVEVVVDNLRSTYNVGSIIRTADGAGLHHLYLCGITPTPDHPKVPKTALGAEQTVAWSYHASALATVTMLQAQGTCIWAFETHPDAVPFRAEDLPVGIPLALVIGNENAGVDPAILAVADRIVYLPMRGRKGSLNVATAFGAAAYLITAALVARSL